MKKFILITFIAIFSMPAFATKCPVPQRNTEAHVSYLEELPDCTVSQYNSKSMVGCSVRGFIMYVVPRSANVSNGDLLSFFRGRDLRGFDFRRADLRGIDFSGSNLRSVQFTNATIMDAKFNGSNLRSADFRGTQAHNAEFLDAGAERADFSLANLSDARFNRAVLDRAKFNGSEIGGAQFSDTNLTRAEFKYQQNTNLTNTGWAQGNDVMFTGATMTSADMSGFWGCYGSRDAAVTAWQANGVNGMISPTRGFRTSR